MNQSFIKNNLIAGLFIGSLIGGGAVYLFGTHSDSTAGEESTAEKQPLYWVAPMDSNYRRDKPGKSPMGMDLIPVYAEVDGSTEAGPGTIKISPEVINNLGVRTAKVQKQPLHAEIKTVGYVQYDEDQLVHIHPRVEGWIDSLFVKAIGDPVQKGQPLYEIYSPALVNSQEELLLAMDRKNSVLIKAAEERLSALQIPDVIVRQLKKSRQVQQNITFYAPQSGVVDNLNIRQGFYVKPGTTLMSIGALDQVWVEAEVFERQVPFIKNGMAVTMRLDYLPGQKWQGRVDYIYPTLDPKTRTVKVRLRFENRDDLLKPNMFAQVEIHAQSDSETLVVPREAVIRTGKQDRVVLALDDGRFKSVAVKIGLQDGTNIEILEGVNEGDKIVTSAQFLIDSESSKTSDFKRMQSLDEQPTSVWTSATIHSLMPKHRMINASHEPIDEWQWPEMTMDFTVAESVDFSQLEEGVSLHLEITKNDDGSYVISNIHIMDHSDDTSAAQPSTAEVDGIINAIDSASRTVNISRGPIEKWNRPAATLDFLVADDVDLASLQSNTSIRFTFEIHDGDFVIVEIDSASNSGSQHKNH